MTAFLPNSPAAESWQRLIINVSESIPDSVDGKDRTIHNLGQRLQQVLTKRYRWTVYRGEDDYPTAYNNIEDYYAKKRSQSQMGEMEGFEIGEQLSRYSVQVLIDAARIAHKHRRNSKFLRGMSAGLGGYSAAQMAKAASLWPEWLLDDPPGAQTVDDCRILFALASLPEAQAMDGYLHWRGDSSLTFYQMYQWVLEMRAQNRIKDHAQYPVYRRKALGELRNMQETAKGERQGVIQGVIETVREKL